MSELRSYRWAPASVRDAFRAARFGETGLTRRAFGAFVWASEHNTRLLDVSATVVLGHRREMPSSLWHVSETGWCVSRLLAMEALPCPAAVAIDSLPTRIVDLAVALRCDTWSQAADMPWIFRADVLGLPVLFAAARVDSDVAQSYEALLPRRAA